MKDATGIERMILTGTSITDCKKVLTEAATARTTPAKRPVKKPMDMFKREYERLLYYAEVLSNEKMALTVCNGEGRNTGLEITADIICHNTSHIIIEIKVYKVFLFILFHNVKNIVVR